MHRSPRIISSALAIICIILTSCAVKAGIRSLIVDDQAAHTPFNKKHTQLQQTSSFCLSIQSVEENNFPASLQAISFAAILATVITVIFRIVFLQKEYNHSLHHQPDLRQALPIFLQYRKLVI